VSVIEQISTADLIPYARNSRTHSDEQVAQIAASIREFGFNNPVLIDAENTIIAGHGRVLAAGRIKLETVPCLRLTHLTDTQRRAYVIADNRIAMNATWDQELLSVELADLNSDDFEMSLLGFDVDELSTLMGFESDKEVIEDEVPELPVDPTTKAGDLWILGDHRLLCGDSTKTEDVARLMDGNRASCVFTDPPYGVSIGEKNRFLNSVQPSGRCLEDIKADDMKPEELKAVLLPAFISLRQNIMADDCSLFVTAPQNGQLGMMMTMMMTEAGLPPRHVLIWKKNNPTFSMGRLDYDYQHEPILFTWCKKHKKVMAGAHRTSVWEIDRERKCDVHPTMKPVALYANAYSNNSDIGDTVADIYAGSGTAFVAAEQLGRKCYGMEISPSYCDVIVKRWETLTGKKATLEAA